MGLPALWCDVGLGHRLRGNWLGASVTEQNRYSVKVRPCQVGHLASVSKETLLDASGMDPWWMGWSPEPSFWRPTEAWAIRRAQQKRLRLERADARRNAVRSVHV